MRTPAYRLTRYLTMALAIAILAPGAAFAADGPVGEWDVLIDNQGQETPGTIIIVEKDGEYSGTAESVQGIIELSDISFEGGELTFSADIPDADMTIGFVGTIDGNSLKGIFEIPDMGFEMAVSGTRGGAAVAIVGTWKLMVESQLGNNPRDLVVNADMSGTYGGGDFDDFDISNLTAKGKVVEFDVTLSVQGQDLPSHVTLTLEGNKVTGTLDFGQGEASIVGEKVDNSIVGEWAMAGESDATGPLERTWTFNDDMTGTYAGDIGSFDITNVKVDGNVVTFDVTLEVQGQSLPSSFKGTLEGGVLSGDLDFGAGTASMKGEKKSS